ncbi:SCO family protein [Brevundimonas sp. AJA228-03]|uniref:SCO family protein n=1 Tax=Brevundimonas sp. AJA228-03 TaxID=2752515 RepID=UPI001AE0999F|nr:SCO family protein [Brevundimonas sp. AJA228-03]QTN20153.1 SCO family protein [Brevundimonas sp. AJA228-03]
MPRRSVLLFAGACIAIAVALAAVTVVVVTGREQAAAVAEGTGTGQASVGGPFQLVNQDGQSVDQTLLNGRWSLVFFGFTYCPDFCPTTLQALAATKARLGAAADDVQIVFISVDPARDTPAALKAYLATDGFPKGVIGLTGTEAQVKSAADAYRAYFQRVGTGPDYTMNHSLTVYLIGPDGQYRSALAHDLGPERSAQLIQRVMARG